jgi:serine protease AprX
MVDISERKTGTRLDARWSALWGTGGRKHAGRFTVVLLTLFAAMLGLSSRAEAAPTAKIPTNLYNQAVANPSAFFDVIAQGSKGQTSANVATEIGNVQKSVPGAAKGVKKKFATVRGDSATLTGAQLVALAADSKIWVITSDAKTAPASYSNSQTWPSSAKLTAYWNKAASGLKAPTIAFVDSGIAANHSAFGGRVSTQVNFYSGSNPNSAGDGLGHGTFTAGIAAGSDAGFAGGVPNVNIVELDVLDDLGSGSTSDMISALDWIQQNKAAYNIKVVNISVVGSDSSSFMYDPLDKAVEKLWLNGVVVVTSAGNYATDGAQSGVLYAPANDPFVITVGASDTNDSGNTNDDFAAPWSAWGYTNDGFFKPEVSAPGRVMNGPVPSTATMIMSHPERQVAPGYMWMSGTSFAAPVVSAAADYVLAMHPSWTPDQVKGALMDSANDPTGYTGAGAMGVGEVSADGATKTDGTANPNVNLNTFVGLDATTGLYAFDTDTWYATASANPMWNAQSWASQSWASATWSTQSWASQSWASQSWASQSWASMGWASMGWASQSWANLAWLR